MKKGSHHSQETRKKMSENHWSKRGYPPPTKGMKFSEETRRKISEGHKGQIPWNKGKKGLQKHSEESRRKISEALKGNKYSLGCKHTEEHKRKFSESTRREKNWRWKGGRRTEKDGYTQILKRDHPFSHASGYVYEHRFIIEQKIGRFLEPEESVHHINKIKDDNRHKNLMAFKSEGIHQRFEKSCEINPSDIIFDGRKL